VPPALLLLPLPCDVNGIGFGLPPPGSVAATVVAAAVACVSPVCAAYALRMS
jgi:hypothetical protein